MSLLGRETHTSTSKQAEWSCVLFRYLTANLTKLIVLISAASRLAAHQRLHADISKLCAQLELAYKNAASNPFYTPGTVRAAR